MFRMGGETNASQKSLNEKRLCKSNGKFTTVKFIIKVLRW